MSKPARRAATAATNPPTDDTAVYLVGDTPILHDGETYAPGDDIELTARQAERLGGKVKPQPTTQPE